MPGDPPQTPVPQASAPLEISLETVRTSYITDLTSVCAGEERTPAHSSQSCSLRATGSLPVSQVFTGQAIKAAILVILLIPLGQVFACQPGFCSAGKELLQLFQNSDGIIHAVLLHKDLGHFIVGCGSFISAREEIDGLL